MQRLWWSQKELKVQLVARLSILSGPDCVGLNQQNGISRHVVFHDSSSMRRWKSDVVHAFWTDKCQCKMQFIFVKCHTEGFGLRCKGSPGFSMHCWTSTSRGHVSRMFLEALHVTGCTSLKSVILGSAGQWLPCESLVVEIWMTDDYSPVVSRHRQHRRHDDQVLQSPMSA